MNNFRLTSHILYDADALMMSFIQDFDADFQMSMQREKNICKVGSLHLSFPHINAPLYRFKSPECKKWVTVTRT